MENCKGAAFEETKHASVACVCRRKKILADESDCGTSHARSTVWAQAIQSRLWVIDKVPFVADVVPPTERNT